MTNIYYTINIISKYLLGRFLLIKWFNFHYRYTGEVLFIEDSEPALGAGGREFESLHPDTLKPYFSRRNEAFIFLT